MAQAAAQRVGYANGDPVEAPADDDTVYPTTAPKWDQLSPEEAAMAGYAPVGYANGGTVQPSADMNRRASLLAGLRKRYDAMIAMAQGALAHRDENAAVRFAQRAHDMVPDGKHLILHVQPDGNILAIVHDPRGGTQSRHVMTPDQFHHYLIGPATSFDHVIENGVGHNLGIATGRPTPRTPDHPADPIHKVRQVLQHTRKMFGLHRIGQQHAPTGYAAGGPVRGYDDGGEVEYAPPSSGMGMEMFTGAPPSFADWIDMLPSSTNIDDRRRQGYIPPSLGLMHMRDTVDKYTNLLRNIGTAITGYSKAAPGSLEEQAGLNDVPTGSRFAPLLNNFFGPVRGYDDGGEVYPSYYDYSNLPSPDAYGGGAPVDNTSPPPDQPWTPEDERDNPPPDQDVNLHQRPVPPPEPITADSSMVDLLSRAGSKLYGGIDERIKAYQDERAKVLPNAWGPVKQALADYVNGANAASPAELSQAKQNEANQNPNLSTPEVVQSLIAGPPDPNTSQLPTAEAPAETTAPGTAATDPRVLATAGQAAAAAGQERDDSANNRPAGVQTPASWADTAGYTPRTGYFAKEPGNKTAGRGSPRQQIQKTGGYGIAPLSPAELKASQYPKEVVPENPNDRIINDPKRPYLHGADPQTGIVPENERKYYGTVNDPPESRYGLAADDPKTVILNDRGAIIALDPENTARLDKRVTQGPRLNPNNPSAIGGYDPRAGAIVDSNTGKRSPIYNARQNIGYIGSDGNVHTPTGRSFDPDSRYGGGPQTGGFPQHAATDSAGRPWYDVPGQPLPAWAAGRGQPADVEGRPLPRQPSKEDLRPVGRNINGVPVNRNGEIIKPDGTLEYTPGYQSQQTVVDRNTGEVLPMTGGTGIPTRPRAGTPGGTGVRGSLNRPFGFSAKDNAYQILSASGALDVVPSDKYGRSAEQQASEGARPRTQDMSRPIGQPMPRGAPPMYVTEKPQPYYDPSTGQVVTPDRQVMPRSGPPVGVAPDSAQAVTRPAWQPLNIPGAANHPPPADDQSPAAVAARAFPMASQTRQRVQYQGTLERQAQEDQLKRDTLATRDTPESRMAREVVKQTGYNFRNLSNNQQKQYHTDMYGVVSDNNRFERAYEALQRNAGESAAQFFKDYRNGVMSNPNYKPSDDELGAMSRAHDLVFGAPGATPSAPVTPKPVAPLPQGGAAPAAPAQQSPNSVLRVPPAQQNLPSGPSAPPPPVPAGLSAQAQWSPSRQQWRTPDGKLYDRNGRPVGP